MDEATTLLTFWNSQHLQKQDGTKPKKLLLNYRERRAGRV